MTRKVRDFDRWVRLTLNARSGRLRIGYEDELGSRGTIVEMGNPAVAGEDDTDPADQWGHLQRLLREGFEDRAESRWNRRADGRVQEVPWLLPVFVQVSDLDPEFPWQYWLRRQLGADGERCVVMREHTIKPVPPLRLPLRLAQSDSSSGLFDRVRAAGWYRNEPAIATHGLRLEDGSGRRRDPADIVFRSMWSDPPSFHFGRRPRLVVTLARLYDLHHPYLTEELEPGVSHLVVFSFSGHQEQSLALEFVRALVHDFALHEIAWILEHGMQVGCLVLSDPPGNQGLRLSSVMRGLLDDVLAGRHGRQARAGQMNFDFRGESDGLTTMARFLAGPVQQVPPAQPKQHRKVDVSMDGYDAHGVLAPLHSYRLNEPLKRGWRYRLRVHIGEADRLTSLMTGDFGSIDDLIPPDTTLATRTLEMVVYPKDFELLSPAVQQLRLPLVGNSAPVMFEIRTPETAGKADLRIVLYLNNNLLQSFVLTADIGVRDAQADGTAVHVRLDSSGVAEFGDLPQVEPRALSLALNDDIAAGSHTLMVKGEDWAKQLSWRRESMNATMNRFRDILRMQKDELGKLRLLAQLGRDIRAKIAFGNPAHARALDAIAGRADATLQFVRHHGGRSFPWQTVYDYTLPIGPAFTNATLCLADRPAVATFDPTQVGCPHCPGQDVICIEGFWLVRHRLEFLREQQDDDAAYPPRALQACAPASNPLVTIGIGTPSGLSSYLHEWLKATLGDALSCITPDDAPVAGMLWNEGRRPAVLVLLSHLYNSNPDLNLPTRLLAFDLDKDVAHISVDELSKHQGKGHWSDPCRPLVLLMACGSGREDTGELIGLVDAFMQSGAAAVAGTEWDVDAARATSFAEDIIRHTLDQHGTAPLGVAIQRHARERLSKGSIAPFIFTTYGSADLTVGRAR